MSLIHAVIAITRKRGAVSVDDLVPLLPEYTRAQLMQALHNGKRRGNLFVVKNKRGLGYGVGTEPARYAVRADYSEPVKQQFSLRQWVEERSVADDDEIGCWHWKLWVEGRRPKGRLNGRNINVRREIWSEQHDGRAMPAKWVAVCRYGTADCTNPDHVTGAKMGYALRCEPLSLAHRAAIAKACRAVRKLSADDVCAIRVSDDPRDVLAQRYGITKAHVGHIKTGRAWREYASPFAGLLAATESQRRVA